MSSLIKQTSGIFLVLCVLLMASCTPSPLSSQKSYPTRSVYPIIRQIPQQVQLISSAWEALSLPTPNTVLLSSTVSPNNPSTIYICTRSSRFPGIASSIALWRTRDAGQHWSSLPLPKTTGTACSISLAPSLQQRIAVLITNRCNDQVPCLYSTLYFSSDSGATWRQFSLAATVPHAATITQNASIVTDHRLYLWYSYSYSNRQALSQYSLLTRSNDDGLTWSRIDSHFEPYSFFLPPQITQSEQLLLSTISLSSTNHSEALLWTSYDAGSSWSRVGTIPPPGDNFLLFSSNSFPISHIPLYALGAEQVPSALYDLKVIQSTNGHNWSLLPPLPVPGTSPAHPGLLQALGSTSDGDFLAFGPDPKVGLPSSLQALPDPIPAFWLWFWNPHTSTWQVLSTPLTYPAREDCGLCWSAQLSSGLDHSQYLYVQRWEEVNSFFRVHLPSLSGATNS